MPPLYLATIKIEAEKFLRNDVIPTGQVTRSRNSDHTVQFHRSKNTKFLSLETAIMTLNGNIRI